MIELRTLGALELTSAAGAPLGAVLAQPRRTALLCYLALGSPRGFRSRDTLYALFWPEHDAEQARHALRQALYFLRRAVGPTAITSRGDGAVALSPEHVRCDAAELEARLDAGQPEAALALYRGELLPGFHLTNAPEFERWLDEERARLQRRAAEAAWALADAREREGNPSGAAEWGRRAAAFSPANEMVLRRLVLLLERLGDRAAAVRAYEAFAWNLEREYELQPSPETQKLVAALRVAGERNGAATQAPHEPHRLAAAVGTGAPGVAERLRGEAAAGTTPVPDGSAAATTSTPAAAVEPPVGESPTPPPAVAASPASRRLRPAVRPAGVVLALCAGLVAIWLGLAGRNRDGSEVQDAIARTVARELDLRLGPAARAPRRRSSTRSVAAYDLYRRGSDRTRLRSDSAAREGVALLRRAVALDPTYAAAWAELALMHHRVGLELPPLERERHHRLAADAARKAVALDDSLAAAHLMMGKIHMAALDLAAAERHLTRAVALDPADAEPHELMVSLYLWLGRPAEALTQAERAVALDSLSPPARAELARALLGNDRCDEALAVLEELSTMRPPLLRVADIAAQCYARKGMWPAAIAVLRPQAERGFPTALAQTAYMLARAGRRGEALRIHATLRERWRRGDGGAFPVGLASAGLGDLDQAHAWFERAIADHSLHGGPSSPGQMMLVLPGPLSSDLRRHPGFARLRARLGLQDAGTQPQVALARALGRQRRPPSGSH